MPGTQDGSSAANAFEWDHSQYAGGTRVYGNTTVNGRDWWMVRLVAGTAYNFQTRLPRYYDTYLYLYNTNGTSLITYNDDSGQDGMNLSRIVYTPSVDGDYFIVVGGYGGQRGQYTLECVPAPEPWFTKVFAFSGSRFSSRAPAETVSQSRLDIVRDRVHMANNSRLDIRGRAGGESRSRFSARNVSQARVASRFRTWKIRTVVVNTGRFSIRRMVLTLFNSRLDVRAFQVSSQQSRLDMRASTGQRNLSRSSVRTSVDAAFQSRHDALVKPGWAIYARDAATSQERFLGFIDEDADPKALTDIPLPDGVYEIEVRPSGYFWKECRGRKVTTLVAQTAGGGVVTTGLPAIQDLTREIVRGVSVIRWKVTEEHPPATFKFGLWFSSTSPVDTSGASDDVIPFYINIGDYQYRRAQTASEYAAVAAFTETDQGPVTELHMPWGTEAPVSPSNQFAYRQEEFS